MLGSQDLNLFLQDFGVPVEHNCKKGLGILDTPDQIFIDGQISSTMYQLVYKTSDFDMKFDDPIKVNLINYRVKETLKMDDGSFSKAMLAKV